MGSGGLGRWLEMVRTFARNMISYLYLFTSGFRAESRAAPFHALILRDIAGALNSGRTCEAGRGIRRPVAICSGHCPRMSGLFEVRQSLASQSGTTTALLRLKPLYPRVWQQKTKGYFSQNEQAVVQTFVTVVQYASDRMNSTTEILIASPSHCALWLFRLFTLAVGNASE
jgi:hypothetical protein